MSAGQVPSAAVPAQPAGRGAGPDSGSPPAPDAAAARRGRRERGLAVVGCLAGSGLVLASSGATWVSARVSPPHGDGEGAVAAPLAVHWTGGTLASTATALALVGLAAAVAIVATRRVGRPIVGLLVLLAGIGIAYTAGRIGWNPLPALRDTDQVRQLAPGNNAEIRDVSRSVAPWLSFAGGLLLTAAGLVVVGRGRTWPAMSGRYQARAAIPADAWDAIERGHDPT